MISRRTRFARLKCIPPINSKENCAAVFAERLCRDARELYRRDSRGMASMRVYTLPSNRYSEMA